MFVLRRAAALVLLAIGITLVVFVLTQLVPSNAVATNLGEPACAPMPDLARRIFHVMPNVTPPGRPVVDWGKR